jgi:hypothetical protein
VSEASLPKLFEGLQNPARGVQDVSISLLNKLESEQAVAPLFAYLEQVHPLLPGDAATALVNSASKASIPLLIEKIKSEDPKTDHPDVVVTALKALNKFKSDLDETVLQELGEALEKQVSPNIIKALSEAMADSQHSPGSFEYLEDLLLNNPKEHVRIAAALSLDGYGAKAVEPLFLRLAKADSPQEIDVLSKAVLQTSKSEEAYPTLLDKAASRNQTVKAVATQGIVAYIAQWQDKGSYDDNKLMAHLAELSGSSNSTIASAASGARDVLVDNKAKDVERLGRRGSFEKSSSDYKKVLALSKKEDLEASIKKAAKAAVKKMDDRREEYEEKQRQEEAERARLAAIAAAEAAARAAQRAAERAAAARRSSSYGGGYSSGGYSSPSPSWSSPSPSCSTPSCSSPSCSSGSSCGSASSCGSSV